MIGWIVAGVVALGAYALCSNSAKKIFVSYDYDGDAKYKNLLKAWSENDKFELEFEDVSVDVSVNSKNAGVIKRVISQRMKRADIFLCLVGEDTHRSRWVAWEIEKAVELSLKIVAVKTKKKWIKPKMLAGAGACWAMSFRRDSILKALNNA